MCFLHSALLPSLILAAVLPLFIHILNLRHPRLFDFPSVQRLRETVAHRSRIFRWRHLLLLLLRTLAVALLIIVFLKPQLPRFGSSQKPNTRRAIVLIVDHSLSMEHKGDGVGSRQRAQTEAEKILSTLGAGDIVNVIVAGQTPKACFNEMSSKLGEARHFLMAIPPGLGRADLSQANAMAARLLAESEARGEIYYLSDFQRRTWANVDFTALPPESRTFFVDCAQANRQNHAILGATVNQAQVLAGDTVTVEVEVGNFRDQPLSESLKVVVDARASFEKEVSAPPWSTTKVTMPVPAGGPGLHQCEISLPPDDLPQDDHFFLSIPVIEKEGILIVSDAPEPNRDAVHFLETALNPYEDQAGSLRPEHISAAQLTDGKLAEVRKVFLTRAGKLTDESAQWIANFVFHGGGLVYFLDGENDRENLEAIQRAAGAPLPLELGPKRVAANINTGAQQIIRGDFKSRYLRLFRGSQRQNLALLEFYDFYDATASGAGNILLHYADETPAMAALNHGLGTMLFMNFSVSEFSSNLARQRVFPAWMQDIVKNLTTEEALPSSTTIGETVTDEVWRNELREAGLKQPSGEPLEPKAEAMGERVGISFVPEELGFYTIRENRLLHSYAVNPPPEESDLRPIDRSLLPERLGETGKSGYFVQGRQDFQDLVLGKPIFHWFILAVTALLIAETALQFFTQRPGTPKT